MPPHTKAARRVQPAEISPVGLRSIDDDHWALSLQCGQVLALLGLTPPVSPIRLRAELDGLRTHLIEHFANEECLMDQAGIVAEHRAAHQLHHRSFLTSFDELLRQGGHLEDTAELIAVNTGHWLQKHATGSDAVLATQVSLIRSGLTPSEAFAQSRPAPTQSNSDDNAEDALSLVDRLLGNASPSRWFKRRSPPPSGQGPALDEFSA